MSSKAKDQTIDKSVEKIISILEKNDIDEALKIWAKSKEYMNKRLSEHVESLQSKATELSYAVERL